MVGDPDSGGSPGYTLQCPDRFQASIWCGRLLPESEQFLGEHRGVKACRN